MMLTESSYPGLDYFISQTNQLQTIPIINCLLLELSFEQTIDCLILNFLKINSLHNFVRSISQYLK